MVTDFTRVQLPITEVYRITFADGTIARWTSHDEEIVMESGAGGETFQPVPITRTLAKYHSNLQVDTVDVSFGIKGVTVGDRNFTIPQIIRRDYIRNARVEIFKVDYIALDELKSEFDGQATGGVTYSGGAITIVVASILDKLNEKFPKMLYTELCNYSLFDSHCGLAKASFKETDAIASGSDKNTIYASIFDFNSIYGEGYWEKGEIQINDSASNNDGVSRTIRKHFDGYVELNTAFDDDINGGEGFDVYPGCDLTGQTCDEKFSNYGNSLLFEYIPKPETIL